MKYFMTIGMAIVLAITPGIAHGQKSPLRRAQLERRYRDRGEQIVRKRLKMTDDQMKKMRQVNSQFADRRRALVRQQQAVQAALRGELARNTSANQRHVAQLNGQLEALRRQRFELQQEEQHQLSTFLTPVQQAQYEGLQAQLRTKMQALRDQPPPATPAKKPSTP
jgi:Spy/CpxP family protein refolding chaperone